jgi:Arc/MetJ family transcription regulator
MTMGARHPEVARGVKGESGEVYAWCMSRTNIDIDEDACSAVMQRYHLASKRDAVNFALRTVAGEPLTVDKARRLRGSGWSGDLDEVRSSRAG